MSSLATLRRIALRSLSAHRLRLFLTALAVVLGTSFVAGAFLLTATLSKAFDDITEGNYAGVDVVLNSSPETSLTFRMQEEIADRPDVEITDTVDQVPVIILDADGDPLQTGGAGSWLLPWTPREEAVSPVPSVIDGTAPDDPDGAVLNDAAAEAAGLVVGDSLTVIDATGRHEFVLDGLTRFDTATGGWAGLQIADDRFREGFTDGTHTDRIVVRGAGTDAETLKRELQDSFPGVDVATGEEAAAQESGEVRDQLSFLTYILLAFGLIGLLVGTFIISNTFSMIVAQRTRDFALLRALGMSGGQLSGSILVEAAIIAVLGSLLGIVVGVGLVELLTWAMDAAGFGFPDAGLGLNAASVLVPLGVGIVVTVLSAWVPARRAGRVHPVQAMRSGDQSTTVPLRGRTISGVVLLVGGLAATLMAALATGWGTGDRGILTGAGTVGIILGVLLVCAIVSRRLFSARFRVGGVVPLLARTNLSRNPRRTAATAFALTLGVALVAAVGILGASMQASIFGQIDESMRADAVVSTGFITAQGVPDQAAGDLREVEGVADVMPATWAPVEVGAQATAPTGPPGVTSVLLTDPRVAVELEIVAGGFDDVATTPGVGLDRSTAERSGLSVGDVITVTAPNVTTRGAEVPVLAVWEDNSAYASVAVSEVTAAELVPDRTIWFTQNVFVTFDEGADEAATLAAVTEEMNSYGVLQVMDRREYRDASAGQIDQLMNIIYALLALSVVIAVLGIINTLALSITERTREFGMLRAVGTQRSQVRWMIVLESVQIAVLGAVVGVVVGVWLGWCLVRILADQGIDRWRIPWDQIAWLLLGALAVGAVAALWPARRAAHTPPLAAVS